MRPDALIDLHCDTLTDDMNACWVQISAGEPLLNEKI